MYFKENISIVYHELMSDLIHMEVPDENWLDCNNCHACSNVSFKRFETKCCDYQPSITNLITGCILNDPNPNLLPGQRLIRKRIKDGLGVTPFGILPSNSYNKSFDYSRDKTRIVSQEETSALKCSFYNQGNCTIYKYRSDICGLHFCKSAGLNHGLAFWKQAKKMNLFLDKTIALLIAKKMGIVIPSIIPKKLKFMSELIETDTGKIDEMKYKTLWGEWYGQEEAYYKKCQSIFDSFSKQKLKNEVGQAFTEYKTSLQELAIAFNKNRVPNYLIFNELKWQQLKSEKKLNSALLIFLKSFNGKNKTADIVKRAAHLQIRLSKYIDKFLEEGVLTQKKNY